MTTRVLPRSEYGRLGADVMGTLWQRLPDEASVIAIEDEGQIVGSLTLVPVYHAECLWIDPRYRRKGGVMLRLIRGMCSAAKRLGLRGFYASSVDDAMTRVLVRRGGVVVPGRHFTLPVEG